ncbi:MAG: dihydroorotate dehydrogenase [Candidatus Altiarchaeota archaeon]
MSAKVDLSCEVCGVELANPTILASGFLGVTASTLKRAVELGAGAVTIKSIGLERREGHKEPVVCEVQSGLLNCVGLSTQGQEAFDELKVALKEIDAPVIASFYGKTTEDYGEIARRLEEIKPSLIEANISCPNVKDEFGLPFGAKADAASQVVKEIKGNSKIPLFVKLTPNVPDIKSIAKAVAEAGADGITAINSVGPGMKINVESAKPILSNNSGGLSGPAIKPIAIRCVYDIFDVVDVPIIGTGGITTGLDAAEMLMAGATAVGVGTVLMYRGLDSFKLITEELSSFMDENGYSKVKDLVGIAHG